MSLFDELFGGSSSSLFEQVNAELARRSGQPAVAPGVSTPFAPGADIFEKVQEEIRRRKGQQDTAFFVGPPTSESPEALRQQRIEVGKDVGMPLRERERIIEEIRQKLTPQARPDIMLKSAAGVIPSILAQQSTSLAGGRIPRSNEPNNPLLQALAEGIAQRTPNIGLQGTALDELTNKAAQAIAVSDEEAAGNPFEVFAGQILGSAPLAVIGPQASLETIVSGPAFKQLAARVGTRAAMTAAENLPQVAYQNLDPDADPKTYAKNVATQLATIAAAGGALEGAGALFRRGEGEPSPPKSVEAEPKATVTDAEASRVISESDPFQSAENIPASEIGALLKTVEEAEQRQQVEAHYQARWDALREQKRKADAAPIVSDEGILVRRGEAGGVDYSQENPLGLPKRQGETGEVVGKEGHLYRGITEDEYNATIGAGRGVKSSQNYSLPGEGTSLAEDFFVAEDYANFGRTDPRTTGKPTYIVEVKRGNADIKLDRDGYHKLQGELPPENITRVWKVSPDADGNLRASEVKGVMGGGMPGRMVGGDIPPTTAGEHVLGGKTNIRLDKFEDADEAVQSAIRQEIENFASIHGTEVIAARRGRISIEETERQAQLMGADPEQLKRILQQGNDVALNETEIRTLGNLLHASSKKLSETAAALRDGSGNVNDFKQAMMFHRAAQLRAHSAWATAGRALRNLKDPMRGMEVDWDRLVAQMKDPGKATKVAEAVDDAFKRGDAVGNAIVRNVAKPNFLDKLFEYRIGAMLAPGYGQLRNLVSNTAFMAKLVEEEFTTAGVEAVSTGFGVRRPREVTFGDAARNVGGLMSGFRMGWKMFRDAMKSEKSEFNRFLVSKGTEAQRSKIPYRHAIGGTAGEIVRIGPRIMMASDDFNKALLYSGKITQLAGQEARRTGQTIAEIIANPPPKMVDEAAHFADVGTFTNRQGALTQAVNDFRRLKGMRWVIPFANTTSNILSRSAERLPFVGFADTARTAAKGVRGGELSRSIARPIVPTIASFMLADWVADGTITGGRPTPESDSKGNLQFSRAAGWQPYSIKWGDRYVSIRAFAPQANTIAAIADLALAHQAEESEQRIEILTKHLIDMYAKESALGEINEFIDIILDSRSREDAIGTMGGQFAGSFLPFNATTGAVARGMDEVDPDTRGFVGQLTQNLPGLRQQLPAKQDLFEREMRGRTGSGFFRTSRVDEGELEALLRAEELAGLKRRLPNEGRPGEGDTPEELIQRFSRAREILTEMGEEPLNRREKKKLDTTDRTPETQSRRELRDILDRLFKGELTMAVMANDKAQFRDTWREAERSGFNIQGGDFGKFWRERKAEIEEWLLQTETGAGSR